MKASYLIQTCVSSPSQWEGRLNDGCAVYIRYRWGVLTISISEPGGTVEEAVQGDCVYENSTGDGMDSYITLSDVCRLTGLEVTL